jgi:hypothetical protein
MKFLHSSRRYFVFIGKGLVSAKFLTTFTHAISHVEEKQTNIEKQTYFSFLLRYSENRFFPDLK